MGGIGRKKKKKRNHSCYYSKLPILTSFAVFILWHALRTFWNLNEIQNYFFRESESIEKYIDMPEGAKTKRKCVHPHANKGAFLWTYPYMPENVDQYQTLFRNDTPTLILCGYPSVCRKISPNHTLINLNLRELTIGTPYESFISHHFYYKVLHGKEYIHHVQSVAACSLLLEDCGFTPISHTSTSRTNNSKEHLLEQCKEYDPTKTGVAPLVFHKTISQNGANPYAILGFDSRVKSAQDANSGDEVQALAGLQFLPEHTMTVDRDTGYSSIKNGNSPLLVANAWYGVNSNFPPPLPSKSENNNIIFTSVHFSGRGKRVILNHKKYWRNYVSHVGAVGARDIPTLNFLKEQGISSYLSLCFTLNFQIPRLSSLVTVEQKPRKNEILMVDVASLANLPPEIRARATKLECNMPDAIKHTEKGRHEYAHNLLSAYADRASVVITSRIHSALPASALGIPVIFIESKDLPGGKGRRTEGISDLFHLQHVDAEWKYGNLSQPLPPAPGVHRIDRYRASFWKLLKEKSPIFEETARLYGMIPLQRLGTKSDCRKADRYQKLFHFILTTKTPDWKAIRAVEYVFYHHPNAQVIIHCKLPNLSSIQHNLGIFVEAGYDLVIKSCETEKLLRDVAKEGQIGSTQEVEAFFNELPKIKKESPHWYSHESDILQFLILYINGGIYMDMDVYVLRPLEKSFVNVVGEQGLTKVTVKGKEFLKNFTANGAFMSFEPRHPIPRMALEWIISNYNIKNSQWWGVIDPDLISRLVKRAAEFNKTLTVLPKEAFQPIYPSQVGPICFESKDHLDLTNTYAIHLNNKMAHEYVTTQAGTPCNEILHQFCIFCHEVHTKGHERNTESQKVVTFP